MLWRPRPVFRLCNAPIQAYLVWTVISCDCDVRRASESTCLCFCWSCAQWVLRGPKESLMGWVTTSIYRKHSCRTRATFLSQDVCERMCSPHYSINTPIYNIQTAELIWVLCGRSAASESISQRKPVWMKYLVIIWHKCFLQGARVQKLVDMERWEFERLQQLLHAIIKQTGAPSANRQQAQLSSSQSANMDPSDNSKPCVQECKQLGSSSFQQSSWYAGPQISYTQWTMFTIAPYHITISTAYRFLVCIKHLNDRDGVQCAKNKRLTFAAQWFEHF